LEGSVETIGWSVTPPAANFNQTDSAKADHFGARVH
jgi:hypothetical protein